MFPSWWHRLIQTVNRKNRSPGDADGRRFLRKPRYRARLEQLEDRLAPAATTKVFLDVGPNIANIAAALRPGGRLAVLAWQDVRKNEWIMTVRETLAAGRDLPMPPVGAPGPMALADQDDVRSLLSGAGFETVGFTSIEEPVWFGADAEAAYEFVGEIGIVKGLSDGLDPDAKAAAHERLTAALRAHETPEGVRFGSGVWLISATKA